MKNEEQEIREAIVEGKNALQSLKEAREKLQSAKNWGVFDMFGGGIFASMVKRGKMEDAISCMEDAKRHLHAFQRELKDVNLYWNLNLNIDSFLSFADFFFDGFVADYLVQSKIQDAAEQVEDAIRMVNEMLARLNASLEERSV